MQKNNILENWARKRKVRVIRRIFESGLEFNVEKVPQIVREMSYENQKMKNPSDCPCYSSKPCHTNVDDLNCFLCACPNYDTKNKDKVGFIGGCKIGSLKGVYLSNIYSGNRNLGFLIWDCSNCTIPHSCEFAENFLRKDFEEYKKVYEKFKRRVGMID